MTFDDATARRAPGAGHGARHPAARGDYDSGREGGDDARGRGTQASPPPARRGIAATTR